jgi:hypothetical protein
MAERQTTDQFIQKAIAVHGNKYGYKHVDYRNCYSKVKIICSVHGEFEQTSNNHLRGQGCPKCKVAARTKSTEVFIEDAKKVHGNKYGYSRVDYKNRQSKVKIICSVHGEFEQRPSHHLWGKGCPKCGVAEQTKSTEVFIEDAKKVHGNKYGYSRVDYKNKKSKVKIICSVHGEFEQRPSDHLWGQGCPKCAHELKISKGEKEFLNEIKIPESDRQFHISSLNYIVDGIDKQTNTIFEYLGDYWHGNPNTMSPPTKIAGGNMTCKQAYEYTFKRFSDIKSLGYNIKYIWESDWNAWKKNPTDPIPIKEYKD